MFWGSFEERSSHGQPVSSRRAVGEATRLLFTILTTILLQLEEPQAGGISPTCWQHRQNNPALVFLIRAEEESCLSEERIKIYGLTNGFLSSH